MINWSTFRWEFSLLIAMGFVTVLTGQQKSGNLVEAILLESKNPLMQRVLNAPDTFHYQIIYEEIKRDRKGRTHFKQHKLNVDPTLYFYPASTIKMANAVVALEKLHALGLSPWLRMYIDSARYPQQITSIDYSAQQQIPTIGHFIEMAFLISDNEASNRLYEFVGQEELHQRLSKRGFNKTRIVHRLGDSRFSPDDNRYTNPIYFLDGPDTVYAQAERHAPLMSRPDLSSMQRGLGYLDERDSLIQQPFDFTQKNFFPLEDQINMVKAIMFPEAISSRKRFDLDSLSYQLLRRAMSRLPRESVHPVLDTAHYYDSYVKFFIFGDSHQSIPDYIRIYNKVGWAYGFLTEVAYIVDTLHDIEFLLAGTIEVNLNQIYNDNQYEFGSIGIPFLAESGRMIYEYEKKRKMR